MHYSIETFLEESGEKKEVISLFASMLKDAGLIDNVKQLNKDHFETFSLIREYKIHTNGTWVDAIDIFIQELKGLKISKLSIDKHTMLKDLLWQIENKKLTVTSDLDHDNDSEYHHIVYDIILENFVSLGYYQHNFKYSCSTDACPVLSFELKGDGFKYYMVGKLNHQNNEEELHIFYNEGNISNAMRLQYIAGGVPEEENIYDEIWEAAIKNTSVTN